MFGWIFGRKPKASRPRPDFSWIDAPTEKQLRYARVLGLDVPQGATREQVSDMISEAEAASPKRRRQREHIRDWTDAKEEESLRPLRRKEAAWEKRCDEHPYVLAIYRDSGIVVDVLQLAGAYLRKDRTIVIFAAPAVRRHGAGIPDWIEWEANIEIAEADMLHLQTVRNAPGMEYGRYLKTVQRGVEIANRMRAAGQI